MSDFNSVESLSKPFKKSTLVAKASGSPITAGTVNWYLKALTGANAGKWWRKSDETWQVAETANAMTHQADGHWTIDLTAVTTSPYTDGAYFLEYVKESGDLHVPDGLGLHAEYTPSADSARKAPATIAAGDIGPNAITAAAAAADFGAEIAALVETYIVNEGDATAVMQAIADKIAADWVAGDASPLAIVAALKADAQWSNLATMAAELAKVPKSDGSAYWNATAIAKIFEADMTAYLTGFSSTKFGPIIARLGTMLKFQGQIATDPGNTPSTFLTTLTGYGVDYFNDFQLVMMSGTGVVGQPRVVTGYVSVTGAITIDEPLATTPPDNSWFMLIGIHTHSETRTAAAVWDYLESSLTIAGSIGKRFKDFMSGMTSLPDWIRRLARGDAGTAGMITAQAEINTGGTSTFDGTTDSLEDIKDAVPASGGTGANTITVTVNDGVNPLENAKVRMTNGAESYLLTTNASGQAVFALDNATWTVVITKPLYTFTSTTLVVSGNASQTYSMTAISTTPSNPGFVTGFLYCYNSAGAVASGVTVYLKLVALPSASTGFALYHDKTPQVSDATGLVQFTGMVPGATYLIYRGTNTKQATTYTMPGGATSPTELPSVIGEP